MILAWFRRHWLLSVCGAIVSARFLLTFQSGFGTYQGYTEVFYVLSAQQLGPNLVPTLNGYEHWNTPPLWTWLLASWGAVFGWSEASMRLPSILAYAATGPAIHRLGTWAGDGQNKRTMAGTATLFWFVMPFPFLWAGRAQTDILLTCLVAWGLVAVLGERPWLSGVTVLGVFVKQPYLALATPAILVRSWRALAGLALPALALVAWVASVGRADEAVASLGNHVEYREGGFWAVAELAAHGLLMGTGAVLLVPVLVRPAWRRLAPLWAIVAVFLAFTAYAAPPGHTYYFLPAYAVLPVIAAHALHARLGSLAGPRWGLVCLPLLVFAVFDAGETWDDRTRELARYGDVAGVETGLQLHAQYYLGHEVPALTGSPLPGRNWWFSEHDGCDTLVEKPDWFRRERPSIYLIDCPPTGS